MELPSSNSKRSKLIDKLRGDRSARESYLRATLNIMVPSQIKALRLQEPWTQKELGIAADMKQARISAAEKPGKVAFSLETLIRLAAAFKVGLQLRFVPLSTMLDWENGYSQDTFNVMKIDDDHSFLKPKTSSAEDESAIRNGTNDMNVLKGEDSSDGNEFKQGGCRVFDNMASSGGNELWQ
jgi:transcriptional regulator with XRE-family HTH domain